MLSVDIEWQKQPEFATLHDNVCLFVSFATRHMHLQIKRVTANSPEIQ